MHTFLAIRAILIFLSPWLNMYNCCNRNSENPLAVDEPLQVIPEVMRTIRFFSFDLMRSWRIFLDILNEVVVGAIQYAERSSVEPFNCQIRTYQLVQLECGLCQSHGPTNTKDYVLKAVLNVYKA